MGVLDRARQAAVQAAEQARHAPAIADRIGEVPAVGGEPGPGDARRQPRGVGPEDDPWQQASSETALPGPAGEPAAPGQSVDWSQLGIQVRDAAGRAKGGLASVLERVDPGMLADVVVRATALQETTNRSLRDRGSPYRIGELTIIATIPPQIAFSIQRLGDREDAQPSVGPAAG